MFGLVAPDLTLLSKEDTERYNCFYCGLCRTLSHKYGQLSRLSLSYDLTFLAILLSSLYEPKEEFDRKACLIHPIGPKGYVKNSAIEFAADMTIMLTWYKCMDDWKDDRNIVAKKYANLLERAFQSVHTVYSDISDQVQCELGKLEMLEKSRCTVIDEPANCFGRLLARVFVWKEDCWSDSLAEIGYSIGKFIYLADAALDFKRDIRKESYNPFASELPKPEVLEQTLSSVLAQASVSLERLPLEQDICILNNILYSGLWYTLRRKGLIKNGTRSL